MVAIILIQSPLDSKEQCPSFQMLFSGQTARKGHHYHMTAVPDPAASDTRSGASG